MLNPNDCTIIIPHLGSTDEQEYAIEQCLLSLHETAPDIRKVIVKNGLHCRGQHMMPNCSFISLSEQGQCRAVNAAVATVNTEWVFVTNDDMIYSPGWFERLTDGIENKMCISPKLIEPRPGAPTFETYFCGGAGGDFDKAKWLEFATNYRGQGFRTGFNLPFLIKKELWDTIGGYDINFDPFGSNGDSCLQTKIMLAGVQPYQNTNCIVYHFAETSGTSAPENRPYWQHNWNYYIDKYGFERASSPKIWESVDIIQYDKLKFHPDWENKYAKKL